jgi:hypothetical protein
MMMRLLDPPDAWIGVLAIPDYDIKLWYPPPSSNYLVGLIQKQLMELAGCQSLQQAPAPNVIIGWRSWITVFGYRAFLTSLLGFLRKYTCAYSDYNAVLEMYKISALLLVSVSAVESTDLLPELLRYANEELNNEKIAVFYAWFVMIVVGGRKKEAHKNFASVLKFCQEVLKESNCGSSPHVSFALAIIKLGLKLPHLRSLLDRRLLELIVKMNDWQTAIDFCKMVDLVD